MSVLCSHSDSMYMYYTALSMNVAVHSKNMVGLRQGYYIQ